MAKCKGCGANIIWLTTKAGKLMPANPDPVTYELDPKGMFTLIGSGGEVEKGRLVVCGSKTGYVPHWVTCPCGDVFRARRKK